MFSIFDSSNLSLTKDSLCNSCDVSFFISSNWWSLSPLHNLVYEAVFTNYHFPFMAYSYSENIWRNNGQLWRIGFVSMGHVCTHLTWCQLSNPSCNKDRFFLVEQSFHLVTENMKKQFTSIRNMDWDKKNVTRWVFLDLDTW